MAKQTKTINRVIGKRYDCMMRRCYEPKDPSYKNYGGKGIRVAGPWIQDIANFRAWFLTALKAAGLEQDFFLANSFGYHIDRINHDGHYTPDNCRIGTVQANQRNRSNRVRKIVESAEGIKIEI